MKLLRKIDSYFLYDGVTEESAPLSDYFIYYGTLAFLLMVLIIFIIKLINL